MNDFDKKFLLQIRNIRNVLILGVVCLAGLLSTSIYYVVRDVADRKERYAREHTFDKDSAQLADEAVLIDTPNKWIELLKLSKQRQKTHPKDAGAYWMAGQAYYQTGDYAKAIASWRKSAELRPGWKKIAQQWIDTARKDMEAQKKPN